MQIGTPRKQAKTIAKHKILRQELVQKKELHQRTTQFIVVETQVGQMRQSAEFWGNFT